MSKKNLALIFGGQSTEHEVSCMSAANIAASVDTDEWNILLLGITKDGRWLLAESIESIRDGSWEKSPVKAILSPDASMRALTVGNEDGGYDRVRLDAAFPVLHGKYGEDGTIQGLFELMGLPYVGCGVLASAVGMDKFYTKIIADRAGVRQAGYVRVSRQELSDPGLMDKKISEIEALKYPVFIKPSRAGSSVGVSKAHSREELITALLRAGEVDDKILAEEYIEGREIECAVLKVGGEAARASGVGEILAAAEFYDYDAKYNNSESRTLVDPDLKEDVTEAIRSAAVRVFDALDGYGLARVDFFVRGGSEVIFNEINTIPGFTAISMYPMLWEARGLSERELISLLLESALKRYETL